MSAKYTTMKRALRKTTQSYIEEVSIKHNNFYGYSKVIYKGCFEKIIIICPLHGEFLQKPSEHLFGKGCTKCGNISTTNNTLNLAKNSFIDKAIKIHGNKYNYSKVNYVNAKSHVIIVCPDHGEFKQVPNYHLSGNGCSICYSESNGFGRGNFIKSCKKGYGIFYIIKCWNDNETFYKVGITSRTVAERFRRTDRFPYNYTIVLQVKGNPDYIYNMEKRVIRYYKDYRITPTKIFKGNSECFNLTYKIVEDDFRGNEELTRKRTEGIIQEVKGYKIEE